METSSELREALQDHFREDREDFASINAKLATIKDNHLAHIQDAMTSIASDVKEMKSGLNQNTKDTAEAKVNIGWMMKIGGSVLGTVFVAVVGLIFVILRKGAGL